MPEQDNRGRMAQMEALRRLWEIANGVQPRYVQKCPINSNNPFKITCLDRKSAHAASASSSSYGSGIASISIR